MTNPAILRDTHVRTMEFLLSEADGNRSRDVFTVQANAALIEAGTLMGKVTATSKIIPYVHTAVDGSQTAIGVLRNRVNISTVDTKQVCFVRDCEVDTALLTGADSFGLIALQALGVIAR